MSKKEEFDELQKAIDKKKEEVKRGELSPDMYNAWACGYLAGELFKYYGDIPNTQLNLKY